MKRAASELWPVLRLPWIAVALAAGILLGEHTGPLAAAPRVWWAATALLALAAPIHGMHGTGRRAVWAAAALLVGAALGAGERARTVSVPGAVPDDRGSDEITGVVDGPVTATRWGHALRVVVEGSGARVRVTVDRRITAAPAALPGDRVRVSGRLRTPRGYRNPGSVDRRALAASRGADLELRADAITVVTPAAERTPWRVASRWQAAASRWIAARGGDPEGNAVVRGAVLGDRSAIAPSVDDAWRAAGVYHVLSVSGLHLAVVALLSFAALRRVLALAGGGVDATRGAALVAAALAVAYTMVTGAEVATVRALVVALVVLAGAALARRARALDALGLAAVLILAHTPSVIRDPSFQLSFAATAALLAAPAPAPIAVETSQARRALAAAGRWLRRGLAASLAATLVTAPITALHFHEVALGGVAGNLVATPIVELLVIPLALVGLVVAQVSDAAGGVLVDAAVAVCGVVHDGVAWLAGWTPVVAVPPPTGAQAIACAALVVAWSLRSRVARRWTVGAAAVAVVVLAATFVPRSESSLRVTFLDVGQGDAAVVETPGGEVWLIDAGGLPYAPPGDPALASAPGEAVARFLAARRIRRIDVAIVSHPHPDHYLGLLAVVERVPIGELWTAAPPPDVPPIPASARAPSFETVAAALVGRGTRLLTPVLGIARRRGATALHVLAPVYDPGDGALPHAAADPVRSVNDDSLVVAVEHAGRRVLFTGDIEAEGEDRLVSLSRSALRSDVVKVPHHGSGTSSGEALVAATRPAIAVMSLGVANRYGFPADDVVHRWTAGGARVLRTDLAGAITVEIDAGGQLDVSTYDP